MKRALIFAVLAALVCAAMPAAAAGTENVRFTPSLANAMAYTVGEWTGTSLDRALLTVLLAADTAALAPGVDWEEMLFNDSYVGWDAELVTVVGYTDDHIVLVTYGPGSGTAWYSVTENAFIGDASPFIRDVVAEYCSGGCRMNDFGDIMTVLEALRELLEGGGGSYRGNEDLPPQGPTAGSQGRAA